MADEYVKRIVPSFKKIEDFWHKFVSTGLVPTIIFLVIFLILFTILVKSIFYTIAPGQAAVRWSRFHGGTQIDYVYPEGWNYITPWDKMYIYNIRIQEISHEMSVLSKNGLKVDLNLSIRFAPKYKLLGLLHQKIGPDYANTVIIPEVEAVLREIIGTMEAENIYTTGRALIVEAINKAIEQVAQRYIDIDKVLIKSIQLPDSVEQAIRYKIEQKHLIEATEFIVEKEKKEADRKRVEAAGLRDYNKIVEDSLSKKIMDWKAIQATMELAKSNNSKVILVGAGERGLPIFGGIQVDDLTKESSKDNDKDNNKKEIIKK
ncbi:MAG: prohibitin family protein [Desulfobacterales bacterium]|nr:prohibitin family protein [Desulfobacterales bacterium]MBF0398127.1 prohibitin family protein [Desulfobacterales bacterium]